MPGDPTQISTGPGQILFAAAGSAYPTDLLTPWPAAWIPAGYTKEGSAWNHTPKVASIEVAEEFYPVGYVTEGMESGAKFSLAQLTATNLRRAINGGTVVTGSGFVIVSPPAPGEEIRIMLGFQSQDGQERVIYFQVFQVGTVDTARKKGADYGLIPVEYKCEKPAGLPPWQHIYATPGRA